MADRAEHPTPYFGLRDFLFYLVPGLTVFSSILLIFTDITVDEVKEYGTIATSILAILISYILGHFIYPLNYPLRHFIRLVFRIWDEPLRKLDKTSEESEEFNKGYHYTVMYNSAFFFSEVSRNRSLARFSSAMVIPTILLGVAFCFRTSAGIDWKDMSFSLLGFVGSLGFAYRYTRYYKRYRQYVKICCAARKDEKTSKRKEDKSDHTILH